MGHWSVHRHRTGRTQESAYLPRVLTNASGNIQNSSAVSKSYVNFGKQNLETAQSISKPHYPLPSATLKSNDKEASTNGISTNKSRRSSHQRYRPLRERSYLNNEEYITYRARKRFDKGDDGKPVWSDEVEESFQNALIHIPPMGKKKKTQHGKLFGRNELIKEWIFQETGEVRHRKQISSHIQVLNKFFKDDLEWQSVVIHDDEDDHEDDDPTSNHGPAFYFHSIADQVRLQRDLQAQAKREAEAENTFFDFLSCPPRISNISFDMWVGMPERITQALHNYTRITNNRSILPTVPLDDCDGWKGHFPDLESILPSSANEHFDIVLVKSRIALMSDFPPLTSKLGLVLDLDFRSPGDSQTTAEFTSFSSVNHMYLNGELFRKKEHKDCPTTEPGVIKPVFEADWWATQFTELTHRTKDAEANMCANTLEHADEYSRTLLRGLTVMQEVFVPLNASTNSLSLQKRIAVLLWTFAQAEKSHNGITTWQKISLPVDHQQSVNPTPEPGHTTLPSPVLDSGFEYPFAPDSMESAFLDEEEQDRQANSPTSYQTCSYHSGFTPLQSMEDEHPAEFDFSFQTGFTPRPPISGVVKQEQLDLAMAIDTIPVFQQSSPCETQENQQVSALVDLSAPPTTYHEPNTIMAAYYQIPQSPSFDEPPRGLSLASFDVSTHQMLQEQLGNFDDACHRNESPYDIGSQQSVTGQMDSLELEPELQDQTMMEISATDSEGFEYRTVSIDHPTIFVSPKFVRPPLMAHNSFAGILHTSEQSDQICFDTPTRNDFAQLVSNHFDHFCEHNALGNSQIMIEQLHFPSDHIRPRSQPILPSNDTDRFDISEYGLPPGDGSFSEIKAAKL